MSWDSAIRSGWRESDPDYYQRLNCGCHRYGESYYFCEEHTRLMATGRPVEDDDERTVEGV